MAHVWVVEWYDYALDKWLITSCRAYETREEARDKMKKIDYPDIKYRVRKYVRVHGSE